MKNKNNDLGFRIRQLRQKQFKTQSQIAYELGISIPAYCKIETGLTDINITRLKQISALFGVSTEALLTGDESHLCLRGELNSLKTKLDESCKECMDLQRKLIGAYELLDELKNKYQDTGEVIMLTHNSQ
ncbi:MAG TPA: helix-turn-helix transcriptional regulator [Pedobacter sp.]|uniref:helix-turn-helix domain-containing protein n=1 Tax=Pedobacter sp. TaxID=1411316 RepID=UPI002BC0CBDC|nr:helix-turn-helix transcriptional regulator [Pedobacter sp.]HMI01884.1 helix-turn-helix transcriptional regulator [Pedobacter sp.]